MTRYANYESALLQTMWTWADQHHQGEFDGIERQGRPPVLADRFASKNILVPRNSRKAHEIRAAIPERERHRWFTSLKSSQALAQSFFGAIRAFNRLDLLQDVPTECGRPAFFEGLHGSTLEFEHEVRGLGEPRPTSIDVLLRGPQKRIAIECKFTEREFGTCSRPRLRPGDKTYPEQHCDGSYRIQRGRRERCALTEIGVQYWQHLPQLFDWTADCDHVPCPLEDVYQLARNALAATLTPDGAIDQTTGHTLVVYDARNPEFQEGGKAEIKWASATLDCRIPGLLRRLSWQSLLATLADAPELAYLVDGVQTKYGLKPE